MRLSFLHTNDLHGRLTSANVAPLAKAREAVDYYFDTGDCIKTGNLGIPLGKEPVWGLLKSLDCTASVIGNRETHILESTFRAKLDGAFHPVLCANLRHKNGTKPLQSSLILSHQGLKIGVFGVSVAMVSEKMATRAASAYLWDPPIKVATEVAKELRDQVDLLIALTHIGNTQDVKLAETFPDIDIILGGHSHTVLQKPDKIGRTWVCQGGSHAHYFGLYEWSNGALTGGLVPWQS